MRVRRSATGPLRERSLMMRKSFRLQGHAFAYRVASGAIAPSNSAIAFTAAALAAPRP
jgi:hypothetical protein